MHWNLPENPFLEEVSMAWVLAFDTIYHWFSRRWIYAFLPGRAAPAHLPATDTLHLFYWENFQKDLLLLFKIWTLSKLPAREGKGGILKTKVEPTAVKNSLDTRKSMSRKLHQSRGSTNKWPKEGQTNNVSTPEPTGKEHTGNIQMSGGSEKHQTSQTKTMTLIHWPQI